MARDLASPRRALGWCQLLLCAAIAWAAYELTESLPYWPINPYIATTPWFTLQLDLVRCLWVVLPGAILWGASFPLALAAVATTEQDAARLAGGVYAANTVGAIVGSLVTSFILIPWIGTSHAEQVSSSCRRSRRSSCSSRRLPARTRSAEHPPSDRETRLERHGDCACSRWR